MDYIVNHFNEIATAIFLACFTAWLGWRTWRKSRRVSAGDKFNTTVLELFEGLYPSPVNWPDRGNEIDYILIAIFPKLESAVTEFKRTIPLVHRGAFDKAWDVYLHSPDGSDRGHYYQYMGYTSPDSDIPDSKIAFHENVARLLSFAK